MNGDLIHNEMGLIKDFLPNQEFRAYLNYIVIIYVQLLEQFLFIKDKSI